MSDEKDNDKIHQLAGGWITERKGTPIPTFLKLAYVGFSAFGFVYLFLYWSGEVGHATRGPLVREANAIMETPSVVWIGIIAGCIGLFAIGLLWFAFFHRSEEE